MQQEDVGAGAVWSGLQCRCSLKLRQEGCKFEPRLGSLVTWQDPVMHALEHTHMLRHTPGTEHVVQCEGSEFDQF